MAASPAFTVPGTQEALRVRPGKRRGSEVVCAVCALHVREHTPYTPAPLVQLACASRDGDRT